MKKIILAVGFAAILTGAAMLMNGCTSSTSTVTCAIETSVINSAVSTIATQASCTNTDAMKTDFKEALKSLNFCSSSTSTQGVIGDTLCPAVATTITNLVNNKIPATWGCTGGTAMDTLQTLISTNCKKAITL